MKSSKTSALLLAIASALVLPKLAFAATDGTPGPTSTANLNVSVTIAPPVEPVVQILNLDDLIFPTVQRLPGSAIYSTIKAQDQFCIIRNVSGAVGIRIQRSGYWQGNEFVLVSFPNIGGISRPPIELPVNFYVSQNSVVRSIGSQYNLNLNIIKDSCNISSPDFDRLDFIAEILGTSLNNQEKIGEFSASFNVIVSAM
jgi:hypothetical protein